MMEVQHNPPAIESTGCCPRFDPAGFQDAEISWQGEPFVADHVRSVFHVPLNMNRRMSKNQELIQASGAAAAVPLTLTFERSPSSGAVRPKTSSFPRCPDVSAP